MFEHKLLCSKSFLCINFYLQVPCRHLMLILTAIRFSMRVYLIFFCVGIFSSVAGGKKRMVLYIGFQPTCMEISHSRQNFNVFAFTPAKGSNPSLRLMVFLALQHSYCRVARQSSVVVCKKHCLRNRQPH